MNGTCPDVSLFDTSATSEVPVGRVTPGGDLLSEMLKPSVSSGTVSGSMTVFSERSSVSSPTGVVVSSEVSTSDGLHQFPRKVALIVFWVGSW